MSFGPKVESGDVRVLLQLSAGSIVLFSGGFIGVLESELFFLAITMQLLLLCLGVKGEK